MTVAAARKQQKEVDLMLKKVEDGQEEFSYVWDQAAGSSGPQREKLGEELKKSINKLQRLRVQIREWSGQSDMKGNLKDKLEEARKKIEGDMTRFKEFERDLKTKAFSSNALAKGEELELEEAEKLRYQDWISSSIQQLNDQRDEFEADLELLSNKKTLSNDEKSRMTELREWQDQHEFHIRKLELILRALDNDALELSDLACIRDSVDYYLESHKEPGFMHDEGLYDGIDLQEFEERAKARTPTMDASKELASNKDESSKKSKEKDRKKKDEKKDKKKEDKKVEPQGAAKQAVVVSSKRGELLPVAAKEAAAQAAAGGADAKATAENKKPVRSIVDDLAEDEIKVQADQLLGDAEEFICKICQVHVVGCSPKLTNCSHLFCGDCLAQWFAQHPESQTWAQRARSAGPERVVPCPVCKQPLNEKKDLYPVCGATSRSENLLLWRMLSALKIVCMNSCQLRKKDGKCDWVGEYGQYQKHVKACQNLPVAESREPPEKEEAAPRTAIGASPTSAPVGRPDVSASPAAAPAPTLPPASPAPTTQPSLATQAAPARTPQETAASTPVGAAPRPAASATPAAAPRVQQQQKPQVQQPPQPPQPSQSQQSVQQPPQPPQPPQKQQSSQQPQQQPAASVSSSQSTADSPSTATAAATSKGAAAASPAKAAEAPAAEEALRATCAFEPTGPNMVQVRPGDMIQVLERHASGWTFCKNISAPNGSSEAAGWAPSWIVQPLQSAEEEKPPAAQTQPQAASAAKEPQQAAVAAAPTPQHSIAASQPVAASAPASQLLQQLQQPQTTTQSQTVLRPAAAEAAAPAAATAAAPKAPQTVVRAAVATFTSASPSQLSLVAGDLVEIVERDASGWTYGRKVLGAPVEGWFPDWCTAAAASPAQK
eukprot:TRINITY_DN886_c0_g2_i1.p1 TRINITY_DN886_c0_g2~~TRINITY_DN886_c0_g2_i1.p1  ORF type:complete len:889 (-),score=246.94 TRINITY_DN886_c0_g2_i1:100-2766(-)